MIDAALRAARGTRLREAMKAAGVKPGMLAPLLAPILQVPEAKAAARVPDYWRPSRRNCISLPEILAIADRLRVHPSQLWVRLTPWEERLLSALEVARMHGDSPRSCGSLVLTIQAGDRRIERTYPLTFDRRGRSFRSLPNAACRIGPEGSGVRLHLEDALDVAEFYDLAMACLM